MGRREGPNSNEIIQSKLRLREKLAREQRRTDMEEVLSTPGGRRFMYRLIFDDGGLMNLYPGQDSGIYRHEGQRTLAYRLALEMQNDHVDAYVRMITEHLQDQENEKKLSDAAHTGEEDNGE